MGRTPHHALLAVRLILVPWLVGLVASCGGGQQQEARTAPPSQAIVAERGRPIADDVLLPWMEYHRIPGVSIAVASGDAIDWAKGYGVADAVTRRPVSADTVFQAASISKPIAAVTALALFDELRLDVDADVRGFLDSWPLPENAFTQRVPVTLRLLLSHSAGVNVHGFLGYQAAERLPSLLQILNGTAPANNEAIRVTAEPAAAYRYSGGGYEVVEQILEDVGGPGASYAALVQTRVFAPAAMSRSSLLDPLDPDAAATAHDESGHVFAGRWHRYPELAAAAVWTTPSDLLRFAVLLQRSYRGASEVLLPAAVTRQMMTRQRPTNDAPGRFIGVGVFLEASAENAYFQHGGGNPGYRCYLQAWLEQPLAIAIMTNSEAGGPLLGPVVEAIRVAYSR